VRLFEVNERSTAYVTATFLDRAGEPAVPESVTYRVDCETTGSPLVAPGPAVPGSTVEIVVPAALNAIQSPDNEFETKIVTLTAVYGPGDQITQAYRYRVRNLKKIV
jgi:hypothetical protein